jgi:hypothetical protein
VVLLWVRQEEVLAGAGTQTAGLAFGGLDDTDVIQIATEEYNGSSWTTIVLELGYVKKSY